MKDYNQSKLTGAYHLLDPYAMKVLAEVLKEGEEKYGHFNWHDIPIIEHLNHALFHLFAYLRGDGGEDHLSHAATRLLLALAKREHENNSLEQYKQFFEE